MSLKTWYTPLTQPEVVTQLVYMRPGFITSSEKNDYEDRMMVILS